MHGRGFARFLITALVTLTLLLPSTTAPVTASGETRTLYLHHTHTGETARFTFKRNGVYDQGVLRQMNAFLADWRNKKQTNMDPALFDLIWTIYQEVGATEPVNIVSSYRSPETNAMLHARSSGVAENSQHMKGKAMDIFIPGVKLSLLRETAMSHQVGGVGYYPTSGSPFVHVDTGTVRAWPRMTTAQLKKVFPDGRTLHLPTDGHPLSAEGRRYAEAEWNKCHMVPCNGASTFRTLDDDNAPVPATPGKNLMDTIFHHDATQVEVAAVDDAPTQRAVKVIEFDAPTPLPRPTALAAGEAAPADIPFGSPSEPLDVAALDPDAPTPMLKSQALMVATTSPQQTPVAVGSPGFDGETALVALANLGAPVPKARVLMTQPPDEGDSMVTAYVPTMTPEPGAQRALEMIIERETTSALPATRPADLPPKPAVQSASLGSPSGNALQGLFDTTFNAFQEATSPSPVATALLARTAPAPDVSFAASATDFVAPDLEHVVDILGEPAPVSSRHFAELYEAEGYLSKSTELGAFATRVGFEPDVPVRAYDRFNLSPLLVVSQ